MEPAVILPVYYMGPISYYKQLLGAGEAALHTGELYRKQTARNHCVVYSANGPVKLTVPVSFKKSTAVITREVRIAEDKSWKRVHWNTLTSCYNNSPFFEYYADYYHQIYEACYSFLIDFTLALTDITLRLLKTERKPAIVHTNEGVCTAPALLTNAAGLEPYYQPFAQKHGFIPDLSIIDLLANEGPNAKNLLI